MTSKVMNIISLIIVVFALFWNKGEAQSSCMTTLVGLAPCMNYVTGNSSTPSSTCCTALSSVVQSNPQCLCSLVNGGGSGLGITINQTLALALPAACNVQTPPLSQCNAAANGPSASVPASSPSGSPAPTGSSDEIPEIPATPSGSGSTGSKTDTSRNGSSNAGSSNIKISFSLMGFILFIVSSVLA
ncbi:non-specific lipid transfer protein GPI-anchored 5-like isoform X1 [Solanum verrucosum]|uniref:non-specific lipid transfer protein GPI-anchored 5-like isoform X1 n=1 Tax=Solanum verrucosum TaxID=315347 RepID=UPI0020D1BACB|nr:non-specific lipid transfer protein GPI-anchored 5-like isoform X1 [Solanum verrucosum]